MHSQTNKFDSLGCRGKPVQTYLTKKALPIKQLPETLPEKGLVTGGPIKVFCMLERHLILVRGNKDSRYR